MSVYYIIFFLLTQHFYNEDTTYAGKVFYKDSQSLSQNYHLLWVPSKMTLNLSIPDTPQTDLCPRERTAMVQINNSKMKKIKLTNQCLNEQIITTIPFFSKSMSPVYITKIPLFLQQITLIWYNMYSMAVSANESCTLNMLDTYIR